MRDVEICRCVVKADTILYYSDGDMIGELVRLRRNQGLYFWYRDVLIQAQERGFIVIVGHSDISPFWWRKFDDSVDVCSGKLREAIAKDEREHGKI